MKCHGFLFPPEGADMVEISVVKLGEAADDAKTVREALEFALEHSRNPSKWIFPHYRSGLEAYDSWIKALEGGSADAGGNSYNAAVWGECRRFAVEFLKEAGERLGARYGGLFDEALKHYEVVAESLGMLAELFLFEGPSSYGRTVGDDDRCIDAVRYLREARRAEESGLRALEAISKALAT